MTDQDYYQALANAYAQKHLCTTTKPINVSSLARTDSYRGKYPHDRPRPLLTEDSTPEEVAEYTALTAPDGGRYPLTNKLDYVFFKRQMRAELGEDGRTHFVQVPREGTE